VDRLDRTASSTDRFVPFTHPSHANQTKPNQTSPPLPSHQFQCNPKTRDQRTSSSAPRTHEPGTANNAGSTGTPKRTSR
jgi:hypothetical protein